VKSPKTYVILLLALTTIGGAALAYKQYQELIELRAAAMNKDERADLQKRIWDLEKLNRELTDSLAAARLGDGDMDGLAAVETPADENRGGRGGRGEGRGGRGNNGLAQQAINELLAKPEAQAVLAAQRKLAIEKQYAALFKNLNLNPEQAEKLKTILADRQNTLQDARSLAREQGLSREDSRKLFEQTQADINASIKSVIGESGLAQMQTYEQTMPQRNLVRDLADRLSYTSTPLTGQQQESLIGILAANQPQRTAPDAANQGGRRGGNFGGNGPGLGGGNGPGGGNGTGVGGALQGGGFGGRGGPDIGALAGAFLGGGGGFNGGGPTISPVAVSQSQSILSAPQVTALQQMQQQQQAQRQLQQTVRSTLQQLAPPQAQTGTGGARGGRGGRGGG
jgi:hypothetical protein